MHCDAGERDGAHYGSNTADDVLHYKIPPLYFNCRKSPAALSARSDAPQEIELYSIIELLPTNKMLDFPGAPPKDVTFTRYTIRLFSALL
jgi:hypothetical protein